MTTVIYKTTEQNKRLYNEKFKPLITQGIINIPGYHAVLDLFYDDVKTNITSVGNSTAFFIKTDISNFFESIPREEIIQACTELSPLIDVPVQDIITTCCKIDKNRNLFIPVGYSTSSFLAEYIVSKKIKNIPECRVYRYVDDLIIICENKDKKAEIAHLPKDNIELIIPWVHANFFSSTKWIQLKPSKTIVYPRFTNDLRFLGIKFRVNRNEIHPVKITGKSGMKKYNHYAFVLAKKVKENKNFSYGQTSKLVQLIQKNKDSFSQQDWAILNGLFSSNVLSSWFFEKIYYFANVLNKENKSNV